MLTAIHDGDSIFSAAIEIASVEERHAYIARVCGNDAALRRQVEERVAEHFQARSGSEKPAVAAAAGAVPPKRKLERAGTHEADHREDPHQESSQPRQGVRKYPRGLAAAVALMLLAAAVAGAILTVRALRVEEQARTALHQAEEESERARKEATESKRRFDQAEAARQTSATERDQELAVEKAAQLSAEDTKAVLAFLQDKLLSAGRQKGWVGGQWAGEPNKGVTLLEAVNAAEEKVAEVFADRPLAEASIREMLGLSYLDLGEAALAVKQYQRALALREAMLGPDHPETASCRNKLAVAYRRAGRGDEASRLYDQNPDSPSHAAALAVQGSVLLSQKKPAEAELKLRECLAIRQKIQPDDWTTFNTKSMLGAALLNQKKYADAEPLLLSGYRGMKQLQAKLPPEAKVHLTETLERLARLYEVWGKKAEAVRWRKELATVKAAKQA